MSKAAGDAVSTVVSRYIKEHFQDYMEDLKTLVNIDSGTPNKAGVDRIGTILAEKFRRIGATVTVEEQPIYGNNLLVQLKGTGKARILLIGHMDTVYPDGTVAERPFRIEGQRAIGPGVSDMKNGTLGAFYVFAALQSAGYDRFGTLTMICNSDEEIGSPGSHALVEAQAQQADYALILEAGRANGDVVSARKGVGTFEIEARGVSAHAGVEPQKGRNAILELAHQTVALQALNGTIPGVSVSVGFIQGGGPTNVVPDHAILKFDVRAADIASMEQITKAIQRVVSQVTVPDITLMLTGHFAHRPFVKTPASAKLVELVKEEGALLGLKINDVASGGGSDGNTTAVLGVPTVDGMGPQGNKAHNPGEYLDIPTVVPRLTLLTRVIQRLSEE